MEPTSAQVRFWQWFKKNGNPLRALMYGEDHVARQAAGDELREAAGKVLPGVVLEFGPDEAGQPLPLIVSVDGKPDLVDDVKELVASAPPLAGWTVIAFRPRMEIGDSIGIEIEGEKVAADDIWFDVIELD